MLHCQDDAPNEFDNYFSIYLSLMHFNMLPVLDSYFILWSFVNSILTTYLTTMNSIKLNMYFIVYKILKHE